MATTEEFDAAWPPGTVKLQALLKSDTDPDKDAIILQPRPTDDPNDPLNWPTWQKALDFGLACFYAMLVYAFVNATSVTWGPLQAELGFTSDTLLDTYAIGCATLALGAPMLIPFALKFGSRPIYVISSLGQFAISVWSGKLETAASWWGINAVQCWLGALAEVLVQMTIADIFFVHQRGTMNSVYVWVANVGQNLAIVAAGYITLNMGWRWVWWWCAILFGLQLIMFLFGFEETKYISYTTLVGREGGVDEEKHRKSISEKRGSDSASEPVDTPFMPPAEPTPTLHGQATDAATIRKMSTIHIDTTKTRRPYWKRLGLTTTSPGPWAHFMRHSWQPFWILFTIPGVGYAAIVYGILTALSTVQTSASSLLLLDPPYNFDAAQIGLISLAPFVGGSLGSLICGPVSDWLALRLCRKNKGIYEPEMRFWLFPPFACFLIAGLWWFAYALNNGAPWPQVAVAYAICWFGVAPIQSLALTYILDAYNEIVGDALTAVTTVRNIFSTILVFALPRWIDAVGTANVFNTIGAIAVLILGFSGVFLWKGKDFRIRTAKRYRVFAARQFEARTIA